MDYLCLGNGMSEGECFTAFFHRFSFLRKHLALGLHSTLPFTGAFNTLHCMVGPCTNAVGLEGCVG